MPIHNIISEYKTSDGYSVVLCYNEYDDYWTVYCWTNNNDLHWKKSGRYDNAFTEDKANEEFERWR